MPMYFCLLKRTSYLQKFQEVDDNVVSLKPKPTFPNTVNQQILAAIKFGVSQKKVI